MQFLFGFVSGMLVLILFLVVWWSALEEKKKVKMGRGYTYE